MEINRTVVHCWFDATVSIFGMFFSAVVVLLAATKVKNKALKSYSLMLITNATVDFVYALNTLLTFTTAVFGEKIVFMLMDNYPITSIIGAYAALATQLFLMFLGVAMLPLQFIYRYGVMIQKPFTNWQMFLMFCGSLMLGGLHGGLSPFTFRPRNDYYDEKLREAMDVGTNFTLPFYVVGDVSKFGIMSLHFINIFVIMAISYSIIITMVYLSKRSVTLVCSDQLSKQTRTVQKQVTKIIYLQALYPVLFVAIPCSIFPVIAVKGWQIPYFAEVAMSLMHTPPLVNSVLVILCVPSYRRSVMRPFRTNSARETSTNGRKSLSVNPKS